MSLLPRSRMIADDIPMTLGALVREAIQPKRDPIKEFERGDHSVKFVGVDDTAEQFRERFTPPSAHSATKQEFKVGDRVRWTEEVMRDYMFTKNPEWVIARIEGNKVYDSDNTHDTIDHLELIPSAPAQDAEGWIAHKPGDPCPIPGVMRFVAHFDTPFNGSYEETRGHWLADCYWDDSKNTRKVVAYRVLP